MERCFGLSAPLFSFHRRRLLLHYSIVAAFYTCIIPTPLMSTIHLFIALIVQYRFATLWFYIYYIIQIFSKVLERHVTALYPGLLPVHCPGHAGPTRSHSLAGNFHNRQHVVNHMVKKRRRWNSAAKAAGVGMKKATQKSKTSFHRYGPPAGWADDIPWMKTY